MKLNKKIKQKKIICFLQQISEKINKETKKLT